MTDMYFQKRYRKAFIIIDTCQSASLIPKVLEGDWSWLLDITT